MTRLGTMVWNFAKALKEHAKTGFKTVSPVEYATRMAICIECPLLKKDDRCQECGCHMPTKAGWASSFCPLLERKWNSVK